MAGVVHSTIRDLSRIRFFGDAEAAVGRCVLTPDFHKGAGIPVGTVLGTSGFVLPRCAGSDIGCGLRLVATSLTVDEFDAIGPRLDAALRHTFFEGGRDIAFDERGREAILRDGAPGVRPPSGGGGIWRSLDPATLERDLARTHLGGSWPTRDCWAFGDYVRGSGGISRDAAIGSIGGGNHFVEMTATDECLGRRACWDWGLRRNCVNVMVHTGSVGLGGMVGGHFTDLARKLHPRGIAVPSHGFHPLPTVGPLAAHGEAYMSAMGLAANFAVVNRLMLAALAVNCLSACAGRDIGATLVYDAPHNLVWRSGGGYLHRKGACPAEMDHADPVFPGGHPVILPGSMGDASYVLRGMGSAGSLCSAPHGAGRIAARGEGRRRDVSEMAKIRVVTKIDPARVRRDIADELQRTLMEEAPGAYKPVLPALDTVAGAGIAAAVARLRPLLTVKG